MRTTRSISFLALALLAVATAGCSSGDDAPSDSPSPSPSTSVCPAVEYPYLDRCLSVEERVDDLLGRMTLDEKFGQMTQIEVNSIGLGDVATFGLGSVLAGGGSAGTGIPESWLALVTARQREAVEGSRLGIPILFGIDAVHGFGSMHGATVYPHQIGLGAANDPDLMERIGHATAEEVAATGIRWTFSPVLAVPSDVRWGRTYEAYSQDPAIVSSLGAAYIRGLQGDDLTALDSIIATPKHFVGDGSTTFGSSTQFIITPYLLDQGDTPDDPALLATLLQPYQAAIDAGARSLMVSFSSWGGEKVHGRVDLLTDVLRGDLGFAGFVVSDWGGIDQIDPSSYEDSVVRAINAGVDMAMVPYDAEAYLDALRAGVESGAISTDRIDEAVRRILTVKVEMGLFENPYPDPALLDTIGNDEHRALAREAVQKSLVLLENDEALPLADDAQTIVVVGNASSNMGIQAGGWSMSWQGDQGPVIPGTTILGGIRERAGTDTTVLTSLPESGTVDVCIAVVGEPPYAEGVGDSSDLALPGLSVVDQFAGHCETSILVVLSGRPVIITDALDKVDAVVAAWLPGTAGEGVADVLFGDVPFTGTLPMNWPADASQLPSEPGDPALYPIGYGMTG